MCQRCTNPNIPQFKDYGGRGIFVCAEWQGLPNGFWQFIKDMGDRPDNHSLDRIDNAKGYSPENCKWSTKSEQQLNQRNTRIVVIEGVSYKAAILAKTYGFKTDTIVHRASLGLPFSEVVNKNRRIFFDGLLFGGKANGMKQKSKTHCPKGHEYNEQNISYSAEGYRRCKVCHRMREAQRRDKR